MYPLDTAKLMLASVNKETGSKMRQRQDDMKEDKAWWDEMRWAAIDSLKKTEVIFWFQFSFRLEIRVN